MGAAKKKAKPAKPELRVLAFRITSAQFDALTAACAKHEVTKTDLVIQGLQLALAKRGDAKAAEKFSA